MTNKEIEARFLNLDQVEIEKKLRAADAENMRDAFFREWIFELPEWGTDSRRIRVRTDGTTTWLTYKSNKTYTVDSTEEIEVIVSSAEEASKLIQAIGIPLVRYQEKKRTSYRLGNTIFDIDLWPKIPMVLEIEAPSEEEVKEGARLLKLDWSTAIFEDQKLVHRKYYGIDLDVATDYRFPTA